MLPWRPCELLDKYLAELKVPKHRYKFFVMIGRSPTAKTQRLKHAFGSEDLVLEVNCASCPEPDIRAFNHSVHKGILYDEASCDMVLAQKKLFQSPNALVVLGSSTTNCHAYTKWVWGTAQFIASNTWEEELDALESEADREWLIANSHVINVRSQKQYLEDVE
jgi:hypothetical protein